MFRAKETIKNARMRGGSYQIEPKYCTRHTVGTTLNFIVDKIFGFRVFMSPADDD